MNGSSEVIIEVEFNLSAVVQGAHHIHVFNQCHRLVTEGLLRTMTAGGGIELSSSVHDASVLCASCPTLWPLSKLN